VFGPTQGCALGEQGSIALEVTETFLWFMPSRYDHRKRNSANQTSGDQGIPRNALIRAHEQLGETQGHIRAADLNGAIMLCTAMKDEVTGGEFKAGGYEERDFADAEFDAHLPITKVAVAIVHGIVNVMACPGGCACGGGSARRG
jgi:hypothetical protein